MPIENILNLTDLNPREILNYSRGLLGQLHNRAQYIGPGLFPARNVRKLSFEYIKGSSRGKVPVMAGIKAINAASPVANRRAQLIKQTGDIPAIARKVEVDGETLIKL